MSEQLVLDPQATPPRTSKAALIDADAERTVGRRALIQRCRLVIRWELTRTLSNEGMQSISTIGAPLQ